MEADGGLEIFREVLQSLVDERPLADTLDLISRRVSELAGFDFCGIVLPDAEWRRVHLAGAHGFPAHYAERLNDIFLAPVADEALAGSPTRTAIRERRTVVMEDALTDESFRPWRSLALEFGYRSLVAVPLMAQGEAIGVLNGYSGRPRRFDPAELGTVEALAGQAALALRMATLVQARRETIAMLERAHDIHLQLTATVIAGAGFTAVAQTLAGLIDRPVAVADAGRRLICTSDPPPDPELVDAVLAAPALGDGERTLAVPAGTAVVGPIRIGAELLGHVVVQEGDAAARELDLRAVEHAATVLALEIVKERVARATEERLRADFLSDLLSGRDDLAERIAERARHHGLALRAEHRVVVMSLDGLSRSDEQLAARAVRAIADVIAERAPGSLVGRVGDGIAAAALTDGLPEPLPALRRAIDGARRRIGQIAPGAGVTAAIGGPARGAGAFARSHRDAVQCLELLHRLGRRGETAAAEELGVLRLVIDGRGREELAALAEHVLGPVLGDGALFDTLDAFLDSGADVRGCAARLHVHENTVRYRLRRVQELCGLDLRRPDDLLQATLARLVVKLLPGLRPPRPDAATLHRRST